MIKTPGLKTKWYPPYTDGRPTFPHRVYSRMAGVYFIREDSKLVYIGYSDTNLYRTMYRHFQQWNHRGQEVITYASRLNRHRYTVRILITPWREAHKWEARLIKKHKPRDAYREEIQYTDYYSTEEGRKMDEIYKELEAAGIFK